VPQALIWGPAEVAVVSAVRLPPEASRRELPVQREPVVLRRVAQRLPAAQLPLAAWMQVPQSRRVVLPRTAHL